MRQLERETAAAKSKELATAESQIYSDLTVSIGKLKSQLEKADAIKKILTVKEGTVSREQAAATEARIWNIRASSCLQAPSSTTGCSQEAEERRNTHARVEVFMRTRK